MRILIGLGDLALAVVAGYLALTTRDALRTLVDGVFG